MATTIALGQEVTVDGTAVEYLIDETTATLQKPYQTLTITMSTNSGTIQFSVGVTPPAGAKAWASGTSFVLNSGVQNGVFNLWAKGSGAGQKFTVS